MANMRFRPLNHLFCRVSLAGLLCLAGVCIARAGDDGQESMIYVPSKRTGTNAQHELSSEARRFESRLPGMQHHLIDVDSLLQGVPEAPKPPPPLPAKLTQKEQDEMDRRANWVFMTPQEIMLGYEAGKAFEEKKPDREMESPMEDTYQPTSALERYYKRMLDPGHFGVTNSVAKQAAEPESSDHETNYFALEDYSRRKNVQPFDSPFDNSPARGIFESGNQKIFSDIFKVEGDSSAPNAEALREQKREQAHIESFKQLWDIDQPAPPVSSTLPVSAGSAAVAKSFQNSQPALGIAESSIGGLSGQSGLVGTQPAPPPTHTAPLHYQFQMPPRRL